jgi:Zn-dependent protease
VVAALAFAFFGVYWAAFGWPLALGLVVSIYIHEMGHVAALVHLGKKASAPMFIPGVGAFVSYSRGITDPREDAYIGLAGPIWGAGAGLTAFGIAKWTGSDAWMAIAHLSGVLNLFNLLPAFGLDGSHGFKALNAMQRWGVVAALAFAFWLTSFKLIVLLVIVSAWRAFGRDAGPGDERTFANFLGLVGVLAWMASLSPM